MTNTSDIEGMFAFPFQTEIAFLVSIFTTAKHLVVSGWSHINQKQYWNACLCVLLLLAYVGFIAGVVCAVMPWLKCFIVSKLGLSVLWVAPVKSGLTWSIGRMVAAICRKFSSIN